MDGDGPAYQMLIEPIDATMKGTIFRVGSSSKNYFSQDISTKYTEPKNIAWNTVNAEPPSLSEQVKISFGMIIFKNKEPLPTDHPAKRMIIVLVGKRLSLGFQLLLVLADLE